MASDGGNPIYVYSCFLYLQIILVTSAMHVPALLGWYSTRLLSSFLRLSFDYSIILPLFPRDLHLRCPIICSSLTVRIFSYIVYHTTTWISSCGTGNPGITKTSGSHPPLSRISSSFTAPNAMAERHKCWLGGCLFPLGKNPEGIHRLLNFSMSMFQDTKQA